MFAYPNPFEISPSKKSRTINMEENIEKDWIGFGNKAAADLFKKISIGSILKNNPRIRRIYMYFCLYSFFWWGFFSFFIIFRPLFFVISVNFPLWVVFINGALESIFILVLGNKWSVIADRSLNYRKFMVIGNIGLAAVIFLTVFIKNYYTLFLISFIFRATPNPDVFTTTYIYKIADIIHSSETRSVQGFSNDNGDVHAHSLLFKKYLQITTFGNYRRFGSLGWAIMAPFGGLIIMKSGFEWNFIAGASGFIILALIVLIIFPESPKDIAGSFSIEGVIPKGMDGSSGISGASGDETRENNQVRKDDSMTLGEGLKKVLSIPGFKIILLSGFLFGMAETITYSTQGILYGLMTTNNYVLIALAYSIAAYLEFPVMTYIGRLILKTNWQKVVSLTYILSSIRQGFVSLVIIYAGGIYWIYLLQVLRGITFAMYLPMITLGIYSSVKESPNLALSMNNTIRIIASFVGNIIGAIMSVMMKDEYMMFLGIFIFALILSLVSGLILIKKYPKNQKSGL